MTPRRLRLGLAALAVIVGSVSANLLIMQPTDGRQARPEHAYRGLAHLPGQAPDGTGASEAERARLAQRVAAAAAAGGAGASASEAGSPASLKQTGVDNDASADLVRKVQAALTARGYSPGEADGRLGLVTRAAIMAFEHDRGLTLTAQPSELLLAHIEERVPRTAAQPAGRAGGEAESIVRTVQQSLARLGYRPGAADGVLGYATRAAISAFERDHGLPESGRVSGLMLVRLADLATRGHLASR